MNSFDDIVFFKMIVLTEHEVNLKNNYLWYGECDFGFLILQGDALSPDTLLFTTRYSIMIVIV